MTGLVSIKYDICCKICQNDVDYLRDAITNNIIGLRCDICGREWRII